MQSHECLLHWTAHMMIYRTKWESEHPVHEKDDVYYQLHRNEQVAVTRANKRSPETHLSRLIFIIKISIQQ